MTPIDPSTEAFEQRGIGYCLTDANGFGLSDLRALELDEGFADILRDLLAREGTVKRAAFDEAFNAELPRAYDLLQAAVLCGGLRYKTTMWDVPTGYGFDFSLSQVA